MGRNFFLALTLLACSSTMSSEVIPPEETKSANEFVALEGTCFCFCKQDVPPLIDNFNNHINAKKPEPLFTCYPFCTQCSRIDGDNVKGCETCAWWLAYWTSFYEPNSFSQLKFCKFLSCAKGKKDDWRYCATSICDAGLVVGAPTPQCMQCDFDCCDNVDCSCINKDNCKSACELLGSACLCVGEGVAVCCGELGPIISTMLED